MEKKCEAESLVCIGFDDNGVETTFNIDTFIQKLKVPSKKNEFGTYDSQLVCLGIQNELIKKTIKNHE